MSALFRKRYRNTRPRRGIFARMWRWIFRLVMVSLVGGLIAMGVFILWATSLKIPSRNIDDIIAAQSTKLFDSTGEVVLYDVFSDERRTSVPLDQISHNMQLAILATEDDQFYTHQGYDISGIMRGLCYQVSVVLEMSTFGGRCNPGGGSTITQQVMKNTLLTSERTLERKIKEVVLARKLEEQKTKKEILEIYLNEIAFGGPIYGVEQASLSYFKKHARDLSISESAYLAALPKAPTVYLRDRARLDGRATYILGRMRMLGYISEQEYHTALEEKVEFLNNRDQGIKAPHFVFHVLDQLENRSGEVNDLGSNGYRITTTLNWELQERLEELIHRHADRVSTDFEASNMALVVLENDTGKIRAMVGSKDYFAEDIDGKFNVTTAYRQPGSTFKPFVYALAFSRGYLPETVVWDTPTEFSQSCFPDGEPREGVDEDACYFPSNYDLTFRGPINLRYALAQSLNVPAVKLLYLVGVREAMQLASDMGIMGLTKAPSFYGLNLVLGGGEVRMLDMARAYSTFANEGVHHRLSSWEKITDKDGKMLERYEEDSQQVIDSGVAQIINDVLSDNDAKRPMFGQVSGLYYEDGRDVAVKTGTTNNFRDVWTIGYSDEVTVAVWAGNNDNSPMKPRPASSVVGPVWREAMDISLEYYEAPAFASYEIDEKVARHPVLFGNFEDGAIEYVDTKTGEVVTEDLTSEELSSGRYELQGEVAYHSILHYIDMRDVLATTTLASQKSGLYEHFEYGITQWTQQEGWSEQVASDTIDTLWNTIGPQQPVLNNNTTDRPSTIESKKDIDLYDFSITTPRSRAVFTREDKLKIALAISRSAKIKTIYYYLNSAYLSSGGSRATTWEGRLADVRGLKRENTLRVIVDYSDGTQVVKTVPIFVE